MNMPHWWRRNRILCGLALVLLILTGGFWAAYLYSASSIAEEVEKINAQLNATAEKDKESAFRRILFLELESFERGSLKKEAYKHLALASLVAFILLVFV